MKKKVTLRSFLTFLLLMSCGAVMAQTTPQYSFTNGTNSCNSIPFGNSSTWAPYRSQFLYPPGDFPTLTTPGFITTIYFKACGTTGSMTLDNLQVSIGNTNVTNLTGYVTGLTVARPASNFSYGAITSGDWWAIPLPNPVYIQPNQSIVVDIQKTNSNGAVATSAGGNPLNSTYAGNNTHAYGNSSSASPSTRNYSYAFGFDLFAGYPCTDTPKTSVKGPDKVCPNRDFELRPDSFYSDATYLWEYSNNGTSWSNFTGTTGLYGEITDNITAAKWYRLTVTCIANATWTWTSPPHKVAIAPFYYCYCEEEPAADTGANLGNLTVINSNQLDTVLAKDELTTGTGTPVYRNPMATQKYTGYQDSLQWPCLYRDTNYIYHVSQIHKDNNFVKGVMQGYIDYNRDGLFDPNNERIFVRALTGNGNPPEQIKVSATVPSNAQIGPTGLRLVLSEDTIRGGPCGIFAGAGEVEDYIVEICYEPCKGPVNAGTIVSTDSSMCSGYEYTVTGNTYDTTLSGFSRAWQVSGDKITWLNIPTSLDKDTLNRVFTGQPLYYRLRTICLPTHDTNYSVETLINDKPGYKCYCYSKATGGLGVDTSDIGGVTIGDYTSNAGGPHLRNAIAVQPRTDFTDITPIELFTDSMYEFRLFHTMPVIEHGDAKITVFMDFDNNHEYDIPEERIYTGYTTIGNHTLIDQVVIPRNAITDVPTGMRVIVNNDVGPNIPSDEACGGYLSGETEDYVLIFRKQWTESVNEIGGNIALSIHPNPTNTGKFNIKFATTGNADLVKVQILTVTGQVVQQDVFEYSGGVFSREISIGEQAAGVYLVELQAGEQKVRERLIVQ